MALPISAKYLEIEELFEEEMSWYCPAIIRWPTNRRYGWPTFRLNPSCSWARPHCLTDNIVSFCRQKSFHPVSVERTSQLATVQELVSLATGSA